jgi:hypothetical protein
VPPKTEKRNVANKNDNEFFPKMKGIKIFVKYIKSRCDMEEKGENW